MDWTKMRDDLADDPAVISMATDLDVDVDLIVGKLLRLWSWAGRHTLTGRILGANSSLIDRIARQEQFFKAMEKVRWILCDEKGVTFPKWNRHNSKAAKRRALDQRLKSARRADARLKMSACQADKMRTRREEKRREEKREDNTPPTPSEPLLPLLDGKPGPSPEFLVLWGAYPELGRSKQHEAMAEYVEAIRCVMQARQCGKTGADAWLLNRVIAFAGSWLGQSAFCPQFTNWLKDGRYNDPAAAWKQRKVAAEEIAASLPPPDHKPVNTFPPLRKSS